MKLHSCYSLKYGILPPEELVDWASKANYTSVFLADINSTGAVLSFIRAAQKNNIHPVVGVELRNDMDVKATIMARNNRGFHELNVFLSKYLHQKKDFPDQIPVSYTHLTLPTKA